MPEKILILGPAWVGDMVLAQSLFKTLKANKPNCIIDVAAPAWTLPLLERMPEVSGKIALPFKHGELAFWARIAFGKTLKNQGYTQAIILTNSFKSAILPWAAGIPTRTSFLGEMRYGLINDIRPLDKTKLKKTSRTICHTRPQSRRIIANKHAKSVINDCPRDRMDIGLQGRPKTRQKPHFRALSRRRIRRSQTLAR